MEISIKKKRSDTLLSHIIDGREISRRQQLMLVARLSLPTIFAQVAFILMQYIDASMVGRLGSDDAAAIGLVASTTWLFGSLCGASAVGFSVLVAQFIGAKKYQETRMALKHGIIAVFLFSALLSLIGVAISSFVPGLLGGDPIIYGRAKIYFLIYALSLPVIGLNSLAASMLQCSGNMKIPSALNILMCLLDVCLNLVLIFPPFQLQLFHFAFIIPGANLGVMGAALGTALSELITAGLMLFFLCFKTPVFRFKKEEPIRLSWAFLKKAALISLPVAFENAVVCGAMIASIRIVAPLGNISLSAHSFAITAESLCYMPGYGIAKAATTLVGQSIGAGRKDLAKQLSVMTVVLGMAVMTFMGVLMFIAAPVMIAFLSPDPQVQELGTFILRIEAFAEPMYAAAIVAAGGLQGAGDTFIPSIMNFFSMWAVRLPLSYILAQRFGLVGVWIAMCIELCFRGMILLIRLLRGKWLKVNNEIQEQIL